MLYNNGTQTWEKVEPHLNSTTPPPQAGSSFLEGLLPSSSSDVDAASSFLFEAKKLDSTKRTSARMDYQALAEQRRGDHDHDHDHDHTTYQNADQKAMAMRMSQTSVRLQQSGQVLSSGGSSADNMQMLNFEAMIVPKPEDGFYNRYMLQWNSLVCERLCQAENNPGYGEQPTVQKCKSFLFSPPKKRANSPIEWRMSQCWLSSKPMTEWQHYEDMKQLPCFQPGVPEESDGEDKFVEEDDTSKPRCETVLDMETGKPSGACLDVDCGQGLTEASLHLQGAKEQCEGTVMEGREPTAEETQRSACCTFQAMNQTQGQCKLKMGDPSVRAIAEHLKELAEQDTLAGASSAANDYDLEKQLGKLDSAGAAPLVGASSSSSSTSFLQAELWSTKFQRFYQEKSAALSRMFLWGDHDDDHDRSSSKPAIKISIRHPGEQGDQKADVLANLSETDEGKPDPSELLAEDAKVCSPDICASRSFNEATCESPTENQFVPADHQLEDSPEKNVPHQHECCEFIYPGGSTHRSGEATCQEGFVENPDFDSTQDESVDNPRCIASNNSSTHGHEHNEEDYVDETHSGSWPLGYLTGCAACCCYFCIAIGCIAIPLVICLVVILLVKGQQTPAPTAVPRQPGGAPGGLSPVGAKAPSPGSSLTKQLTSAQITDALKSGALASMGRVAPPTSPDQQTADPAATALLQQEQQYQVGTDGQLLAPADIGSTPTSPLYGQSGSFPLGTDPTQQEVIARVSGTQEQAGAPTSQRSSGGPVGGEAIKTGIFGRQSNRASNAPVTQQIMGSQLQQPGVGVEETQQPEQSQRASQAARRSSAKAKQEPKTSQGGGGMFDGLL
ncbi:unnamed protein product [Amoebophrya sp. A120]|nr:unnamed protein product [Amoebophrya sp. A120]|eukprot:GSA120T00023959001.1